MSKVKQKAIELLSLITEGEITEVKNDGAKVKNLKNDTLNKVINVVRLMGTVNNKDIKEGSTDKDILKAIGDMTVAAFAIEHYDFNKDVINKGLDDLLEGIDTVTDVITSSAIRAIVDQKVEEKLLEILTIVDPQELIKMGLVTIFETCKENGVDYMVMTRLSKESAMYDHMSKMSLDKLATVLINNGHFDMTA